VKEDKDVALGACLLGKKIKHLRFILHGLLERAGVIWLWKSFPSGQKLSN